MLDPILGVDVMHVFAGMFRWLRIGFELAAVILVVVAVIQMLVDRNARKRAEEEMAAQRSAASRKAWITRRANHQKDEEQ